MIFIVGFTLQGVILAVFGRLKIDFLLVIVSYWNLKLHDEYLPYLLVVVLDLSLDSWEEISIYLHHYCFLMVIVTVNIHSPALCLN